MQRPIRVNLFIIIFGVAVSALSLFAAPKHSSGTFWADTRSDFYHRSGCPKYRMPAANRLVTGSEKELIELGYYPDPVCLPHRMVATRAGRVVSVEQPIVAPARLEGIKEKPVSPEPIKETGAEGGFPALSPGETKPSEAKPSPPNPFGTPDLPKPAPSPGATKKPMPPVGPPTVGSNVPLPQQGFGTPSDMRPGERKQTAATRGAPLGRIGRTGQQPFGGIRSGRPTGGGGRGRRR